MWRALGFDVAAAIVFAIVGRASHGSELSLAGIAQTAWPFVVAAIVGSLLASRFGEDSWRRAGLIVWVVTVLGGVGLRLLGGETAQLAFVVVTAAVLALLLLGWRAVAATLARQP
ncbi:MAG: DUF3054 domain-containing protein [Propionibacteriaceae bacterium]|nr:DUF3054 domain-containing protein [Propionibacteriaceae bacterium]